MTKWFIDHPIAHRGLHQGNKVPENSLAALEGCIRKGIPAEVDLRQLACGNIVVFHDENLKRLCGVDRELARCRYEDLTNLRLHQTDEPIPLLGDLLALVKGRIPLLLELKCRHSDGSFEAALNQALADYQGPYALQSFNPMSMLWFNRRLPEVPRGMLVGDFSKENLPDWQKFALRYLLMLPAIRPAFVGVRQDLLPTAPLPWLRRYGRMPILAWTISTANQWDDCLHLCDNIIFEDFLPEGL